MNKPNTLRDKLRLLIESGGGPSRDARELLSAELQTKSTRGLQPLALLGSLRLDLALFVHRYFAVTLCAALLLAGGGAWIAFSALRPARPNVVPMVHTFATAAPSEQFSIVAIRWGAGHGMQFRATQPAAACTTELHSVTSSPALGEEASLTTAEPRVVARAIPSEANIPIGIHSESLHFADPPLDYSGFVVSVSYEQSSIPADPAHPELAATSTNDLNYQAGYRFDWYQEAGVGYSRHTYRNLSSMTTTIAVHNSITGQTTFFHQTTWNGSDDLISLPGLYYTFHANDFKFLGIEPFITAFASKPSAGFLWRASAGLEWNAWDNLNAVITYSREQLNSGTYPAPQNTHNFFDFGLSYRLLQ